MKTARKRQPSLIDALAAIDSLIASEAATEAVYYRSGGASTRYIDRREAMEDVRRAVKQLRYETERNPS